MSIENEFRSEVRGHLEKLTAEMVPVLATLVAYEFPEEVAALVFEVFPGGFTYRFPVRTFFLDEDNSEFFVYEGDKAAYPSPVDPDLLDIERVYPDELPARYLAAAQDMDTQTLAGVELIDWFSKCWDEAGGGHFSRLAIILMHEDIKVFDLKNHAWLSEF